MGKEMSLGSFKDVIYKICLEIIYLISMYKKDLALNDPQGLICHQTNLSVYVLYIKVNIYIHSYSCVNR